MSGSIWQGARARLRAVEPEDWELFHYYDSGSDTEADRLADSIPFPASRETAKKWAGERSLAEPRNDQFWWVIESLEGEVVGTITSHTCSPRNGTFQYGIGIRREQWRKGYATDAIHLVLRFFFRELRYQKVNATVYAFNEASLALHRRLGFREEGRLRRMIFSNGAFHDEVILGLTAEEFDEGEESVSS